MISAALHRSSFHRATVYISDSVECIVIIPNRKIHIDISIIFGFMVSPTQNQDTVAA